ncbi:hypothetical protein J2782_003220 [Brucella pseudogrignonensis]|uniref:Uncharacterized protein n=1 Tax=Brucella pseudogrignonensis TaxID=419475 RepID=A0ABU1MBR9_9HYPH|nr:hypothetical protein [Brucella pseudogrignonensis]
MTDSFVSVSVALAMDRAALPHRVGALVRTPPGMAPPASISTHRHKPTGMTVTWMSMQPTQRLPMATKALAMRSALKQGSALISIRIGR